MKDSSLAATTAFKMLTLSRGQLLSLQSTGQLGPMPIIPVLSGWNSSYTKEGLNKQHA